MTNEKNGQMFKERWSTYAVISFYFASMYFVAYLHVRGASKDMILLVTFVGFLSAGVVIVKARKKFDIIIRVFEETKKNTLTLELILMGFVLYLVWAFLTFKF